MTTRQNETAHMEEDKSQPSEIRQHPETLVHQARCMSAPLQTQSYGVRSPRSRTAELPETTSGALRRRRPDNNGPARFTLFNLSAHTQPEYLRESLLAASIPADAYVQPFLSA